MSGLTLNGTGLSLVPVNPVAASIQVGLTTIAAGTSGRVLYDNGGVLGEMTTSGTGTQLALTNGPTFTAPVLGAATGTSLALNGATLGANALAITGTVAVSSNITISSGTMTATSLQAAAAGQVFWNGRAMIDSPSTLNTSTVVIGSNTHITSTDCFFMFQGVTVNEAGFKRPASTTRIQTRLGNDSDFAFMQAKLQTETNYTAGAIVPTGSVRLYDATGTAYLVPAVAA